MLEKLRKLSSRFVGDIYENKAKTFLQSQGLQFIEKNFTCKLGEIDLIFKEQELLIFVEVKYRQSGQYGASSEMVDYGKLLRLKKTALCYLVTNGYVEQSTPCRFDVIAIQGANIEWIKQVI